MIEMSPITEQTFIKLTTKTFIAVCISAGAGLICLAGLYFGIIAQIKDGQTAILAEIRENKAVQNVRDIKQDFQIGRDSANIVSNTARIVQLEKR